MLYTKYLTEASNDINLTLDSMISKGLKPCLQAPTGTGKTTLVYDRMQREATKGQLSILALPFKSVVDNKRHQAAEVGIISGYADQLDYDSFSHSGKAVQTTFEGALRIIKHTRRTDIKLYIDESHILIANSSIRNSCSELLDLDMCYIGMTATPLHLEDIGFTLYEPKRAIETPKINIKVLTSNNSTSAIVHKVISDYNKDTVLQLRINNKDEIAKACDLANKRGIKYVAIYTVDSEGLLAINGYSGLTKDEVLDAQKGIFSENVDLILNTSKLDCGLDFKLAGTRPFKMIAIGNKVKGVNTLPNAADIAQASNRMRWSNTEDADITIIGQFGNKIHKSAAKAYDANREVYNTVKAIEITKECSWDATQFYTESEYRSLLADYNINLLDSKDIDVKETKDRGRYGCEVFTRLNQFKGSDTLIEKAKYYGFDLLQYFIEHDNIKHTPTINGKAQVIISQLNILFDLYEANTPIDRVWTGKTYSNANAKALISVAKAKKSNTNMGAVMSRADDRGELLKEDLNSLVSTERKAVVKYLQIVHNVKPVAISSDRYKTIKLNNIDKGASSVVTVKKVEAIAPSTSAPDSINNQLNLILADMNTQCASKQI